MGYHIVDIWNESQVDLIDEKAVAAWWRKHCGKDFEWLSMNGNDTYPSFEWEELEHGGFRRSTAALYTRRYVVYDQDWRITDIRRWPASTWDPEPYRYRRHWPWNGAKCNRHRSKGPAMRRRALQAACPDVDWPDAPGPRKKAIVSSADAWDRAERHYFRDRDNSWKLRAKCRHQWQRHDKG